MPVPMSPKNGNKNNNKGFNWGRFSKTLSFWVFILLIPVVLIQLAGRGRRRRRRSTTREYRTQLEHGQHQGRHGVGREEHHRQRSGSATVIGAEDGEAVQPAAAGGELAEPRSTS